MTKDEQAKKLREINSSNRKFYEDIDTVYQELVRSCPPEALTADRVLEFQREAAGIVQRERDFIRSPLHATQKKLAQIAQLARGPVITADTPVTLKAIKRKRGRPTKAETDGRKRVIRSISPEIKGIDYCKALDRAELVPPKNWKTCPPTYVKAYGMKYWRHRIQQERAKAGSRNSRPEIIGN